LIASVFTGCIPRRLMYAQKKSPPPFRGAGSCFLNSAMSPLPES